MARTGQVIGKISDDAVTPIRVFETLTIEVVSLPQGSSRRAPEPQTPAPCKNMLDGYATSCRIRRFAFRDEYSIG
jgi:hypothetical protein